MAHQAATDTEHALTLERFTISTPRLLPRFGCLRCGTDIQAQQQTSVKVDGKDYTVTEMYGRTMHMVQLSGPEGTAMVMVNNQNQITMYANPAGGGTPAQKALIDEVWKAYQAQKNEPFDRTSTE